jgi:hypothetical protein
MARGRTGWTTARVEKLLELNEAGLTAANIADELRKIFHKKDFKPSKSAVIGKLDRLGYKLGQARAKPVAHEAPAPKPTPTSFDRMWWASLSQREQLHILTMPHSKVVSYASASKRSFADSELPRG